MPASESDILAADRFGRRRATVALLMPIFLLEQATMLFRTPVRAVDWVHLCGWALLSTAICAFLATGGLWLRPAGLRRLLNDDIARHHQDKAAQTAMYTMTGTAIVISFWEAMRPGTFTALNALHLVISIGLAAALLRFGLLERRALKAQDDG